jgi:hypothetical protein
MRKHEKIAPKPQENQTRKRDVWWQVEENAVLKPIGYPFGCITDTILEWRNRKLKK